MAQWDTFTCVHNIEQDPNLSIEQDVTEVPDDVGQFNDLLPAFFKLCCYTVAPTDVPAHLWLEGELKRR